MLKKLIAPVLIAGAILGGVASAGSAYAAAPTPPTATATATPQAGSHPLGAWLRAHRRQLRRAAIGISATTIKIAPKDLVTELRSGKSIAQVAGEHGVSTQIVVSALVTAADARINQAVTNHKLTTAQAAKIESALPGRINKLVNHTF
ncbi:MAG TPA: hypothetical protein VMV06_05355 [Acidimicrobiales bacterium]|nr:hypothetical protein [Acidimicrobiales bacterium]